ncbi:hypothetical protein MKZ38_001762 [Zalerion maritima]|uniref:Uncharacterized protein n=1 Tax=Zalerion maritima TaxID=339359 RepID=A0AAD5WXF2_9PEZI|nr:hypothetical protein MKZ38_001762 [Zalerion maritima]
MQRNVCPRPRPLSRSSTVFPRVLLAAAPCFWPGYFLPPNIVLEKLKLGRDEEFDHEKAHEAISVFDGMHGDTPPDNVLRLGDRVVPVDLESVGEVPNDGRRKHSPPLLQHYVSSGHLF